MVRVAMGYQNMCDAFPFSFWNQASEVEDRKILSWVNGDFLITTLNEERVVKKVLDSHEQSGCLAVTSIQRDLPKNPISASS
jgi:hypothetical protein